jgi:hypothetical protein
MYETSLAILLALLTAPNVALKWLKALNDIHTRHFNWRLLCVVKRAELKISTKIWKSKTILPGMVGDATVKVLLNQLLQPPSTF